MAWLNPLTWTAPPDKASAGSPLLVWTSATTLDLYWWGRRLDAEAPVELNAGRQAVAANSDSSARGLIRSPRWRRRAGERAW